MSKYIQNEVKITRTNGIITVNDLILALQKVPQDLPVIASIMDGTEPQSIFWSTEGGKALWSVMVA